jgi:hypothetical protein
MSDNLHQPPPMPGSSPIAAPQPPAANLRLSIAHLLLLMGTCSITFALAGRLPKPGSQEAESQPSGNWRARLELADAAVTGLALAGGIAVVAAMVRKQSLTTSPGHIMLCILAPGSLANLVLSASDPFTFGYTNGDWHLTAYAASAFCEALGWLLLGVLFHRSWLWATVSLVMVSKRIILGAALIATQPVTLIDWTPYLDGVAAMLALAAVIVDLRWGRHRDWLHYTGLVTLLASLAINAGYYV